MKTPAALLVAAGVAFLAYLVWSDVQRKKIAQSVNQAASLTRLAL